MKKTNLIILSCIVFLIVFSLSAYAINEPTQQFNKLFLSPFYIQSTTANTNINFSVIVNPPDKINSVLSAVVNFDIWLNPSVTFSLWVNGQICNNPTYYISTTYAGAGKNTISFDCSNVITHSGTYNIVLRANKDTGAMTGWLDFTYMNNPSGEMDLMGTEYSPNDPATMFVQLKDNQGLPISNGACYLDMWYPLNSSSSHPYTIQDAPMLKAIGDDGIYYYDMTAPSILGVYMLSAKCSYSFNWINFYPETETIYYPTEQINSGTWQGGGSSQVLNSRTDMMYERCDGTIVQPCSANYTFNLSVYGAVSNITNINVYFSGQSDTNGRILTIAYWNGTSFVKLANTLTFTGTGGSTPSAYDEFLTNTIPLSAILNGGSSVIKLRLTTAGSTRVFQNWLTIALLSSSGTIQDVKGSGEMHITNIPQTTANLVQNLTLNINNTQLIQQIWNSSNRSLTETDNIASAVWGWTGGISSSILNFFSTDIWNYVNKTLSPEAYSQISEYVWERPDRNLTFYEVNNISPADIWQYTSRNLTFTEDVYNYSLSAQMTWNWVDRNLTMYPIGNNITAEQIWSYYNRSLSENIPLQIWSYPDRNLTTDIPFEVWSYENRTLTYYTLNLTELIQMINDYNFTEIPIPIIPSQNNQYTSPILNVILYIPK